MEASKHGVVAPVVDVIAAVVADVVIFVVARDLILRGRKRALLYVSDE